MTINAFHWRENASESGLKPKPDYSQLSYYHRKYALGIHPRQLRREGLPVPSQAEAVAMANKKRVKSIDR